MNIFLIIKSLHSLHEKNNDLQYLLLKYFSYITYIHNVYKMLFNQTKENVDILETICHNFFIEQ